MSRVRFAIPKGSLEKATFDLLERAWYTISGRERTYRPRISDPEIELKMLRPQEIPIFVAEGLHDVGITGQDWIQETHANVETLLDLEYGKVKLVIAVPTTLPVTSLSDLFRHFWRQGKPVRISAEYLNISAEYVKANPTYRRAFGKREPMVITPWWRRGTNDKVRIYLSFGATEAKPPEDTDAIIDLIETGTTLERNNLKAIETILESSAVLIANRQALRQRAKREKIYDIMTLLKGVIDGAKKLHIFVNVKEENLDTLLQRLPALKRPTISALSVKGWYSVNTVVEKQEFLTLLPVLRQLAQGLVVHEPRQILPLEEIARDEAYEKS
ncbi:MAG TPA: ATP phosphoribosyltransferase [Blastocatellia bacterium]|nr:ATP phosphoribosyltransferase [Blastocatellia bacterium]